MFDAGVVVRLLFGKHFAVDFTGEFANWHIGGYNVMNIVVGAQMGLRL